MPSITIKVGYVELKTDQEHKARLETEDGYIVFVWKAQGNLFGDYVYNVTSKATGEGFGGFAESVGTAQSKAAELLEGMRNGA